MKIYTVEIAMSYYRIHMHHSCELFAGSRKELFFGEEEALEYMKKEVKALAFEIMESGQQYENKLSEEENFHIFIKDFTCDPQFHFSMELKTHDSDSRNLPEDKFADEFIEMVKRREASRNLEGLYDEVLTIAKGYWQEYDINCQPIPYRNGIQVNEDDSDANGTMLGENIVIKFSDESLDLLDFHLEHLRELPKGIQAGQFVVSTENPDWIFLIDGVPYDIFHYANRRVSAFASCYDGIGFDLKKGTAFELRFDSCELKIGDANSKPYDGYIPLEIQRLHDIFFNDTEPDIDTDALTRFLFNNEGEQLFTPINKVSIDDFKVKKAKPGMF